MMKDLFLSSGVDYEVDEPIVWPYGWLVSSNKTLISCATIWGHWNYQNQSPWPSWSFV
jgi:hypothetical protein